MSPSLQHQFEQDPTTVAPAFLHSSLPAMPSRADSILSSIASMRSDLSDKRRWKNSRWRHPAGISLLLVTVVLWTTSNFLASVSWIFSYGPWKWLGGRDADGTRHRRFLRIILTQSRFFSLLSIRLSLSSRCCRSWRNSGTTIRLRYMSCWKQLDRGAYCTSVPASMTIP
jgi:hypothetical protein